MTGATGRPVPVSESSILVLLLVLLLLIRRHPTTRHERLERVPSLSLSAVLFLDRHGRLLGVDELVESRVWFGEGSGKVDMAVVVEDPAAGLLGSELLLLLLLSLLHLQTNPPNENKKRKEESA